MELLQQLLEMVVESQAASGEIASRAALVPQNGNAQLGEKMVQLMAQILPKWWFREIPLFQGNPGW